jgi:hypothetical protein
MSLPVEILLHASKFHKLPIFPVFSHKKRSPILKGKRHDTATPLYANEILAHRHQLAISMFFIDHVKGSLFQRKCRKNG